MTATSIVVRKVDAVRDARAVARIYNYFVENTAVTFEEQAVGEEEMRRRIETLVAAPYPYLVAEQSGGVVGYAYAGPYSSRSAYRHTAETTIYLDASCTGKGYGRVLYARLIAEAAAQQLRVLLAKIALPNAASVGLHEAVGFRRVGTLTEVGRKFDQWIDVDYMQLTLRTDTDTDIGGRR